MFVVFHDGVHQVCDCLINKYGGNTHPFLCCIYSRQCSGCSWDVNGVFFNGVGMGSDLQSMPAQDYEKRKISIEPQKVVIQCFPCFI